MTNEERLEVATNTFAECLSMLQAKGRVYSRGEVDVLSNFKRVGEALGQDPVTVATVYFLKHVDSVTSYAKTRQEDGVEPIEGRLHDLINYALILKCLIQESKEAA